MSHEQSATNVMSEQDYEYQVALLLDQQREQQRELERQLQRRINQEMAENEQRLAILKESMPEKIRWSTWSPPLRADGTVDPELLAGRS